MRDLANDWGVLRIMCFGSCVNPGELIKRFGNRFERRTAHPLELQSYSLIAALRSCVSPVIKIVIVHLQSVAMYEKVVEAFPSDRPTFQQHPFCHKRAATLAAISN
jgi:hypothetical protein